MSINFSFLFAPDLYFLDIAATDPNFFVGKEMFTSITCFLTFNVCAMLGSYTTSFISWVRICDLFL